MMIKFIKDYFAKKRKIESEGLHAIGIAYNDKFYPNWRNEIRVKQVPINFPDRRL